MSELLTVGSNFLFISAISFFTSSKLNTGFVKSFDTVKMMRNIRDNISQETQGMSMKELKAYIEKN
ncbi:MAG: hypothetical protein FJY16_07110 [Bacteroidetes bacterium]|nr:hypothetical protein [Bacteroidota bacterium]